MAILHIVLTIVLTLVSLVWVSRHLMICRENRLNELLNGESPGPPADPPRISVVIAAKDEADVIEACVRTMLDQDYPNYEVIVCNDRSDDATGEIAEQIASSDDRVRVIHIKDLPAGWCGKNNAMQTGIATAGAEWLCMIDADCKQTSHRTLSVAMQYARDTQADLLSILPNQELHGFWEQVVQPVCSGVMMIWFLPEKVNNPDKPNAYANGAFMLMKRSTYEAIGTHEAVKNKVNEDMHMARLTKEAGLNLQVVRGNGLYTVRMYSGLRGILRGWSRIFYGTFETRKRLIASLAVLTVMGLLPYLAAALGLILAAGGVEPIGWWRACGIAGLTAALIQLTVVYRFYPLIGAKGYLAGTYVLGCGITMLALLGAISKLRKGARLVWRNTEYTS
ncbi:MAG: glycosyltransferase [Phycisphaerae bacterium]|nr:glycosyltransferase [Phycisphaerae bacterium]